MGQQAFEVMLEHGDIGANEQGGHAGKADHVKPLLGACQRRIKPGHQEDAGFHHCGRVQVGRYRGRRLHGMG